jgi:hypothetical protein
MHRIHFLFSLCERGILTVVLRKLDYRAAHRMQHNPPSPILLAGNGSSLSGIVMPPA